MKKIFLVICFILILCTIVLTVNLKNESDNKPITLDFKSRVEDLKKLEVLDMFKVGWLQVMGTTVDVPILNGEVDYDGGHGWISGNSFAFKNRNVIIGHNVLNVSNKPMVNSSILTDFEDLMAFVYYDFAKENMYLSYTEYDTDKIYVIYGIGFYDYGYDSAEGIEDKDLLKKYINDVKKNSIYDYDVDVNENDTIITVKTCTRYFGSDEKQQFVIDARLLRENEVPLKYKVKKTKLYKEYGLIDSYKITNQL